LAVTIGVSAAPAQTIARREANQQQRIRQGVRSGELTRVETRRLEAQEAALHREIVRDRIDGGGLTPAERAKIDRKQDALSRQIFIQKHDGQTRR